MRLFWASEDGREVRVILGTEGGASSQLARLVDGRLEPLGAAVDDELTGWVVDASGLAQALGRRRVHRWDGFAWQVEVELPEDALPGVIYREGASVYVGTTSGTRQTIRRLFEGTAGAQATLEDARALVGLEVVPTPTGVWVLRRFTDDVQRLDVLRGTQWISRALPTRAGGRGMTRVGSSVWLKGAEGQIWETSTTDGAWRLVPGGERFAAPYLWADAAGGAGTGGRVWSLASPALYTPGSGWREWQVNPGGIGFVGEADDTPRLWLQTGLALVHPPSAALDRPATAEPRPIAGLGERWRVASARIFYGPGGRTAMPFFPELGVVDARLAITFVSTPLRAQAQAAGFGADGGLWAAGDGGEVYRRDGSRWVRVGRPSLFDELGADQVIGLSIQSESDLVWIGVGLDASGRPVGLASWWDGRAWGEVVVEPLGELEPSGVASVGRAHWVQLANLERWEAGRRTVVAGVPALDALTACPDGSVAGLAPDAIWTVNPDGVGTRRALPDGHLSGSPGARPVAKVRCTGNELWVMGALGQVYRTAR